MALSRALLLRSFDASKRADLDRLFTAVQSVFSTIAGVCAGRVDARAQWRCRDAVARALPRHTVPCVDQPVDSR